jgi:hypothetical protein
VLTGCSDRNVYVADEDLVLTCDAEKMEGDKLVAGDYLLDHGYTQSTDKARSGSHSVKLNNENQYGFSLEIQDVKKGDAILISVWRSMADASGTIVVTELDTEDALFQQSDMIVKEEDGWGLMEAIFYAKEDYANLGIFLFNPESENAYFDDFSIHGYFNTSKPPANEEGLNLAIPQASLDSLTRYRERSINAGVIAPENKKYVDGSILINGEKVPIELRLKGDWTDHLESDKWSFRIKVRGGKSFNGLRSFSIQHPATRSFMMEWFAHKVYESEDVLTTTYTYVPIYINGENKGVYALEEHFDKQLLESRNRREGPIVKFDESGLWEQMLFAKENAVSYTCPTLLAAEILPFKKNRTYKSPALLNQFSVAQSHMERYRNHDKDVDVYFDIDAIAKYLALSDVLGGKHGYKWHNQRHYFNPVTNKLEPIAFDCYTDQSATQYYEPGLTGMPNEEGEEYALIEFLVSNPNVKYAYYQYLERFSNPKYINQIFDELKNEIEEVEALLGHEYPFCHLNKSFYERNSQFIRNSLPAYNTYSFIEKREAQTKTVNYDKLGKNELHREIALKGYRQRRIDSTAYVIGVENFHPYAVSVFAYSAKSNKDSLIYLDKTIELDAYSDSSNYQEVVLSGVPHTLFFKAENCGQSIFSRKISKWHKATILHTPPTKPSGLVLLSYQNEMMLTKGNYTITQDVVIPKGRLFKIQEGVTINFKNGAGFISYSPVEMLGTESEPIIINSSDGSANGFTIFAKGKEVTMKHVQFKNMNTMHREHWSLTGAVTVYEGDVSMEFCSFESNQCEDALNLIRSSFKMRNCSVSNTSSDGFDADFCSGSVVDSEFSDIGNDCMDFSGSKVEVRSCRIKNAGDKGISGGEKSELDIRDCSIDGVNIAVASKDLSLVEIDKVEILNCHYGFAAYQKKPEFGPAKVIVKSIKQKGYKEMYLLEKGSELIYGNNHYYGKVKFNIDEMYAAFEK